MRILDRYLAKDVLATTLSGVIVLSFFLVVGNLFRELLDLMINQGLGLGSVLYFMALVLPFSLSFTIPWAFLTALLLVFGRMSASNELVALRSCGMSMPRLCAPVFVAAVLLSALCLWINTDVAPAAQQRMMNMIGDLLSRDPAALFRPNEVIDDFPERRIFVGGKQGNELSNVLIFDLDEDGKPTRMLAAKKAVLSLDRESASILFRLKDIRLENRDKLNPSDLTRVREGIAASEGVYRFSLREFAEVNRRRKSISSLRIGELGDHIRKGADGEVLKAQVEWHRRFSAALACLAFSLVAVPLGITANRKETSVGFALGIALAFAYYFFIIMAQTFQNTPSAHPVFLIWLPNIIFAAVGGVMFGRIAMR